MSFLNPAGLWLLLGVPVLILVYLIRVRHEDRPVSSTFIWKLSSRFMKKRLPVQQIKKMLTFLLQLLIIVTVALLAARPAIISGPSCDYIAIIDGSASMQNTDDTGKTRFQYALEEVETLAVQAERGHTVSVMVANNAPAWLVKSSTSKKEVRLALEDASCTLGGCNMDQVMELVQQFCVDSANPQILFYTDNSYTEVTNAQVVDMSKREWNVTVEDLTSQAADIGMTFTGHLTSHNRNARVTIGLRINGILEEILKVECPRDTSTAVTFTAEEVKDFETAEIYVEVEDSLAADNSYAIFHRSDRTYNVTLVSPTPLYLGGALHALGTCKVSVFTSLEGAKLTGQDLYVFDGVVPSVYPTDGSVIVFGDDKLPEGITTGNRIYQPAALTLDPQANNSLYEGLSLEEAVISNYAPLRGNLAWENLFFCNNEPVIASKRLSGGVRYTAVSFDVHDSNLPMQTDFLVLMDNLVEFSIPSFLEGREHIAGDTVTLTVTPNAQQLYVQYPDGSVQDLSTATETASFTIDQTGIYTAAMSTRDGGEYADFFVHLAKEETAVNTYPDLTFELPTLENLQPEDSINEIWFWAALGLLLLILTEWGWYYREQY